MLKKTLFSTVSLMTIFSANAQSIPAEAQNVAEAFVHNYCKFVGPDYSLEDFSIKSADQKTVIGYNDSVKEVKIELELVYGNDDYLLEEKELLTMDNTNGSYRITSASGPCLTIIQHN